MADEKSTPPPSKPEAVQSPMTPNPKRARMTSPEPENSAAVEAQPDNTVQAPELVPSQVAEEEDDLEADVGDDADSAFGSDKSDTTSISSSIYAGYVENGRRYQNLREGEYWAPADEKQFQAMNATHIVYKILDSEAENPLFYSPIKEGAQNILDVGTGSGIWAVEVADEFPSSYVQGVDLSPPPDTWVPPNCKFEVDDVLKKWMFAERGRFDLIHMRDLFGSFTDRQWTGVYKQAYENLAPGGWIEQFESNVTAYSDDNTLPADSVLANCGTLYLGASRKMGRPMDTIDHFRRRIENAGFINVNEKNYKVPIGDWVKNSVLKEAGKFQKIQLLGGVEGYSMFLFTKFGEPTPWTADEVQVWLAKFRNDVSNPNIHAYFLKRRVWAQKPFDKPKEEKETEVTAAA